MCVCMDVCVCVRASVPVCMRACVPMHSCLCVGTHCVCERERERERMRERESGREREGGMRERNRDKILKSKLWKSRQHCVLTSPVWHVFPRSEQAGKEKRSKKKKMYKYWRQNNRRAFFISNA